MIAIGVWDDGNNWFKARYLSLPFYKMEEERKEEESLGNLIKQD